MRYVITPRALEEFKLIWAELPSFGSKCQPKKNFEHTALRFVAKSKAGRITPQQALHLYGKIAEGYRVQHYLNFAFFLEQSQELPSTWRVARVMYADLYRELLKWADEEPACNDLDLRNLELIQHVLERFKERYEQDFVVFSQKTPLRIRIFKLLSIAKEENLSREVRTRRLIDNHGEDARYFRVGRYRFVVTAHKSDPTLWAYVKTFEVAFV